MSRSVVLSRRRWARRGRALGDFVSSFVLATADQLCRSIYGFLSWSSGWIRACVSRRRSRRTSSATVRHQDAGEARHDPQLTREGLGPETKSFAPISERPSVRFDDIAGLEEAKREIQLRMILPVTHPQNARHYGIRTGGGLLLHGPPGTGKTMLAKAVAAEVDAAFYHVRPSDIMAGQVGQAEANIDRLFRTLRRERRAVLFVDEVEALVPSRRRNGSTIMQRVISQMLGEVDGLAKAPDGHVLLLIGATNEPDMIDPAMMRPGRFDAKVYVGLPDRTARYQMLKAYFRDRPVAPDVDLDLLADQTHGMSGADVKNLVEHAADRAFLASLHDGGEQAAIGMVDFLCVLGPGPGAG